MKIAFLGVGNMAQPIIQGIINRGVLEPENVVLFAVDTEKMNSFAESVGAAAADSAESDVKAADILMLAVKPQIMQNLLTELSAVLEEKKPSIISIAAGKTTEFIQSCLNYEAKIARIFPNLNAKVSESISAFCGNKNADADFLSVVEKIALSFGKAIALDEEYFPVFGVLAGCAPAYTFLYIKSLCDAAKEAGLPEDLAYKTAVQVVLGSAKLLSSVSESPETMIDRVCSPGGTTIEGIKSLKENSFQEIVSKAFNASLNRDKSL